MGKLKLYLNPKESRKKVKWEQRTYRTYRKQIRVINLSLTLSIIPLNIKCLNIPIETESP